MVNGVSRPPVYGPYEYGNPAHEAIFGVPAERVHQALQRTRVDWEADYAKWRREKPGSRRRRGSGRRTEPPVTVTTKGPSDEGPFSIERAGVVARSTDDNDQPAPHTSSPQQRPRARP
ncbi:hypothetical protein GCM10010103_77790 [Streptomyces paradoxus]